VEQGFTLIETIIVIVVLSVAFGILIPFTEALRGSANAVLTQQAVALVQGEIDQVIAEKRANGFNSITTGGCALSLLTGFTCSRTVCYVPSTNVDDTSACGTATSYKRVMVTVSNSVLGDVTAVTLLMNY
jgi:prepilin-type N-terminal cleavage/methylation domain-containing protein